MVFRSSSSCRKPITILIITSASTRRGIQRETEHREPPKGIESRRQCACVVYNAVCDDWIILLLTPPSSLSPPMGVKKRNNEMTLCFNECVPAGEVPFAANTKRVGPNVSSHATTVLRRLRYVMIAHTSIFRLLRQEVGVFIYTSRGCPTSSLPSFYLGVRAAA
ncbi:hypothetical protein QTP88_021518 [Uroleucon formosanum]